RSRPVPFRDRTGRHAADRLRGDRALHPGAASLVRGCLRLRARRARRAPRAAAPRHAPVLRRALLCGRLVEGRRRPAGRLRRRAVDRAVVRPPDAAARGRARPGRLRAARRPRRARTIPGRRLRSRLHDGRLRRRPRDGASECAGGNVIEERLDVSVVVPVRNAENLVDECLASIVRARPLEIIVVDGLSTDQTLERVGRYPVTVLSDGGGGLPAARLIGARAARSRWVALVDADIVLPDGALAALLAE